jgi:hypothetical protein
MGDIESRVRAKIEKENEFEKGVYFQHLILDNPAAGRDKKHLHMAKINGDFRMHVPKTLKSHERIYRLAHEEMCYYLHKRGRFFNIAQQQPKLQELKSKKMLSKANLINYEHTGQNLPGETTPP